MLCDITGKSNEIAQYIGKGITHLHKYVFWFEMGVYIPEQMDHFPFCPTITCEQDTNIFKPV